MGGCTLSLIVDSTVTGGRGPSVPAGSLVDSTTSAPAALLLFFHLAFLDCRLVLCMSCENLPVRTQSHVALNL